LFAFLVHIIKIIPLDNPTYKLFSHLDFILIEFLLLVKEWEWWSSIYVTMIYTKWNKTYDDRIFSVCMVGTSTSIGKHETRNLSPSFALRSCGKVLSTRTLSSISTNTLIRRRVPQPADTCGLLRSAITFFIP